MAEAQIQTRCRDCESISDPLKVLSPSELDSIDAGRTEITYQKGEILCKQGAFISNTIFIKKGLIKLFLEGGDHPLCISLEKDGYLIGIPSLFGKGVFHYSAKALTKVDVCQIEIKVFRQHIYSNPIFAASVLQKANEDVVKAYNRLFSMTHKQINGRFAELLEYLRNKIYESNPFALSLSRRDMAELINTSPESVSRLIKEFRNDGIIESKADQMSILDAKRLHQISSFG
jgi:CRP/FNR family transcriptional regulator